MKEYFSIDRNGANSPEEVYVQFGEQTDLLEPDCCGGGIGPEDVARMLAEGWVTLDNDRITVWING